MGVGVCFSRRYESKHRSKIEVDYLDATVSERLNDLLDLSDINHSLASMGLL